MPLCDEAIQPNSKAVQSNSPHVCLAAVDTIALTMTLHARSRVHSVTKETKAGHLLAYNASHNTACVYANAHLCLSVYLMRILYIQPAVLA